MYAEHQSDTLTLATLENTVALPFLTGTGRLTADPELRATANGTAVVSIRLAFNSRRRDDAGEWVDDQLAYVTATAWSALAEAIARDFRRGMEVLVSGELVTKTWNDAKDGVQRSALELTIREIGASPRSAKVTVAKLTRQAEPVGR